MARPANLSGISDRDLRVAVLQLVANGRVSAVEVREAAGRAARIEALEKELRELRGGSNGRVATRRHTTARTVAAPRKAKRKITVTPERRRAMQLQGRYISLLKKLAPRDKARVQNVARADGVPKAVALATKIVG